MRHIVPLAAVLLPLASSALGAQNLERPSTRFPAAELEAISQRGRELAAYDRAAWLGTDAALPMLRAAPQGSLGLYIARNTTEGWEVVFGRLTASADTFLVVYRSVSHGDKYTAEALTPAAADTGFYARAARALELAKADFGPVNRRYNGAVFPVVDGGGEWWVYLTPAPTQTGVWPFGGDARYRVSADGRAIVEKRRMHNGIIESRPAADAAMGYHTAVLDDRPEDSDVFLVLSRQPALPEYVMSETFIFRINTDGSITAFDRSEK